MLTNPIVVLDDISVTRMMEIVYEMKDMGYVVDSDFTFAYTPPGSWTLENGIPRRYATFTFPNPALSTWFILKYR
jgi:hypothetical protein